MPRPTTRTVPKRRLLFGPGTVFAILLAVVLISSGWLDRDRPTDLNAGKVVYEADSQGIMRRVERPSTPATAGAAMPRLWKPEPDYLRAHARALNLTREQQQKVGALVAAWRGEKVALEHEIGRAAEAASARFGAANAERGISGRELAERLRDYSALSRTYDSRREDYWQQAVALLHPAQTRLLGDLERAERERR